MMTRRTLTALCDYALLPLFLIGGMAAAVALQARGVANLLVTPLVVAPVSGAIAILERVRPERAEHRPLDQPLWLEVAHFVVSFELGYGLALGACALLDRAMRGAFPLPLWPASIPLALQLLLAVLLYEGASYWQHRLIHRVPALWRFHALHHSGARLNMVRAIRFHFVDIGTAAFIAYLPLVLLGAPDGIVTLLAVLVSILGALQHGNLRLRTPAWLDWLICTPAVHRHHHSRAADEGDKNFANTLMLFDVVFGSYAPGRSEGPEATGIERDPVPRGLWPQIVAPFRRRRPEPHLVTGE